MIFPQLLTSLKLICFLILSVPVAIFLLATITWILQQQRSLGRAKRRRNDTKNHQEQSSTLLTSAIYCGRVSHTRFLPVKHGFSYPLFFCLLDLQEVPKLFHGKWPLMWPLTYVMNFREHDHLKNGEGMSASSSSSSSSSSLQPQDGHNECLLVPRIRKLVQERTGGKFVPGHDQQILLLTHLSYFGYCFNPVSFYYILKRGQDLNASPSPSSSYDNNNIEAIVAEVSNTPWNEMKCYVLHPDSQDMMQVKDGMCRKQKSIHNENQKSWNSINYIFAKKFHVSPFMDMEHIYDWTFWHLTKHDIVVSTTMKKKKTLMTLGTVTDSSGQEHNVNETVTYFNAFFDISRKSFHPFFICYQLIRFPMYCMIVQIWIHIQAFKLFVKGVEFIPHPEGSETAASRIIGQLMAPLFAVKDWWYRRSRHAYTPTTTTHTTGATPSSTTTTTTARSGYEEGRGHDKVD